VGFEHAILEDEWAQNYALDRAATGIEAIITLVNKILAHERFIVFLT